VTSKPPEGQKDNVGDPDLFDFAVAERMQDCTVCQLNLPQKIDEQLRIASRKKITVATQVAFLKKQYGWEGTDEELISHKNGRHDRKLRELSS
jgi:hypothetical protein